MSVLGRLRPPGADFDEFVRASYPDFVRTAALLLGGDRGHAEDMVQVALLRTARHWHSIRTPHAYVRQSLVNLAKDAWRDRSRRPVEAAQADDDAAGSIVESEQDRIADRDAISRLVARLPYGQRAVLVLRFFDDLSVAETAAALDCSEGTVKAQTNRALAGLRELLDDSEDFPTLEVCRGRR